MDIEQLIKYDIYNQNDDSQPLYLNNYKEYIEKFKNDNLKNYIELLLLTNKGD